MYEEFVNFVVLKNVKMSNLTVGPKNECKILMNLISFDPRKLGTSRKLEALTVYLETKMQKLRFKPYIKNLKCTY